MKNIIMIFDTERLEPLAIYRFFEENNIAPEKSLLRFNSIYASECIDKDDPDKAKKEQLQSELIDFMYDSNGNNKHKENEEQFPLNLNETVFPGDIIIIYCGFLP